MAVNVLDKLNRLKCLKAKKDPWLDLFQLIGEYIHTRKQSFRGEKTPGEFLTREIFDSTAPKANKTMASSLVGLLWPSSSKRFQLTPPRGLSDTEAHRKFYNQISQVVRDILDNPKAGLLSSLDEYMIDQGAFGTSGVEATEHAKLCCMYKSWSVKEVTIDEGRDGMVDTIYIELNFPVQRLVKEYGIENLSQKTQKLYNDQKYDDEVAILISVEPRYMRDPTKLNNLNMPFESTHIEVANKHLIKEAGYEELPIKIGRFTKLNGEVYGRSPGMDALPDVLEANIIWEATTVAIEKNLAPPLGVLDDGRLGGEEIDVSANAINVFNYSGRAGEGNPVFPLFTVGEIKQTIQLLERLSQQISDHFYIDRLLDFNNESQMTLGEAQMRNRIRFATLNSIFARQISEVFSPIIERTFNVALKQGRLGVLEGSLEHEAALIAGEEPIVIPAAVAKLMVKGLDVYNIEYFTPAMRIMQAEEAEGIMRTWEFAKGIAPINPEAMDVLDLDYSISRMGAISGGPAEMVRSQEKIDTIRQARAEALEQQQELEQAKMAAEAVRNIGQSGSQQQKAA